MLKFSFWIVIPFCLASGIIVFLLSKKEKNKLNNALMAVYFTFLISIIVFPIYYDKQLINIRKQEAITVNFIPLEETIKLTKDTFVFFKNVVGNICLLVPLAILLLLRKVNWLIVIFVLICTSLGIELLQLFKNLMYDFNVNYVDIDDFLFNIGGGIIASIIYILFVKFFKKRQCN